MPEHRSVSRRTLMAGMATLSTTVLLSRPARATTLAPTPGQTEGPFYPTSLPADVDHDLVRVHRAAAQAMGTVAHIGGRVLDRAGRPVLGAVVEIWQCDAQGIYRHPRAPNHDQFDGNFQGYGRVAVASDGVYRFRTIKPVPYPGRTPHIHYAVIVPGTGRFVTQMYVAGEPLNARDGLLNAIRDPQARRSVIIPLITADGLEAGAVQGTFDIVLDL
ncbi:protocatechuate 3,4-dioxygenase [Azospirillum brasilense]|uniref:Intradiol ring-cleavage dioxygenase n=1 Tax=Azospirillum brasilense TaxID=192 RepID=A0A6L3B6B2_AZOBR|nr:protocatechuate 3,4-dioxygenase [Azospirillum brasilense]KAA0688192.1 intradiol ring-cleavage dioxygenase [Azospirillum brasilense]